MISFNLEIGINFSDFDPGLSISTAQKALFSADQINGITPIVANITDSTGTHTITLTTGLTIPHPFNTSYWLLSDANYPAEPFPFPVETGATFTVSTLLNYEFKSGFKYDISVASGLKTFDFDIQVSDGSTQTFDFSIEVARVYKVFDFGFEVIPTPTPLVINIAKGER